MDRQQGGRAVAGWSLVELLIVLGVSLVAAGFAAAALAPMASGARAEGAARHLAATLQRERVEAVRSGRTSGLRFRDDGTGGIAFELVADGNGNGLRVAELDAGVDRTRGVPARVSDGFAGVRFAIVDAVPGIDGGPALAAGSDPIRIGGSLLAFAPDGGATSGTLYLASADRRQFAVRVLGATGRVRVYEYERAITQWVSR
jgi:type II secretory pathway pseudopilin PulG